jgi:hypothetical protein
VTDFELFGHLYHSFEDCWDEEERSRDHIHSDMRENGKELNMGREDRFLRDRFVFTPHKCQMGALTLVIEPSS